MKNLHVLGVFCYVLIMSSALLSAGQNDVPSRGFKSLVQLSESLKGPDANQIRRIVQRVAKKIESARIEKVQRVTEALEKSSPSPEKFIIVELIRTDDVDQAVGYVPIITVLQRKNSRLPLASSDLVQLNERDWPFFDSIAATITSSSSEACLTNTAPCFMVVSRFDGSEWKSAFAVDPWTVLGDPKDTQSGNADLIAYNTILLLLKGAFQDGRIDWVFDDQKRAMIGADAYDLIKEAQAGPGGVRGAYKKLLPAK